MKLYLGADHRGYKMKESLKLFLELEKINFKDLGSDHFDPQDDFPGIAASVAEKVQEKNNSKGILICGSSFGVCIAANKFKNIRAVSVFSPKAAKASRRDDNANILCLAADFLTNRQAQKIVSAWLKTSFSGAARHKRRIKMIKELET